MATTKKPQSGKKTGAAKPAPKASANTQSAKKSK